MKNALMLCVYAGTLAGCAFAPVDRPKVDKYAQDYSVSKVIKVSPQIASGAAKSALEAIGYEIQSETPELGMLSTKVRQVMIPDVCDCGTWNGNVVSGFAYSTISIKTEVDGSDQTAVHVRHTCNTTFTGRNLYGGVTRQETYQCASRGSVENEFWKTFGEILDARIK